VWGVSRRENHEFLERRHPSRAEGKVCRRGMGIASHVRGGSRAKTLWRIDEGCSAVSMSGSAMCEVVAAGAVGGSWAEALRAGGQRVQSSQELVIQKEERA